MQEVLAEQVRQLAGRGGGETVTFEELHELASVELDVVAVDLEEAGWRCCGSGGTRSSAC